MDKLKNYLKYRTKNLINKINNNPELQVEDTFNLVKEAYEKLFKEKFLKEKAIHQQ